MNRNTSGRRGGRRPSEESDTATFTFTPEKKKPSEDTGEWATGKRQERSLYEEIGEDDFHISPNRNDLITCQYCGEEYSTTYRRCPCCDERTAGQNLSSRRRKNDFMDPRHLVGVVITFVIIISAGVIVFQQMKPLLGVQNPPTSDTTGDTTPEITPPVVTTPDDTVLPDQTTTPDTVTPDVTTPDTTTPDVTPPASTTLSLNYSDITLQSAESLTFTLSGAGSQTVTWKSSHPEIATVDANGKVENINSDTETKTIEITATVGSESVSCVIRCKPSVTEPTTPETTTPETTTPETTTPDTSSPEGGTNITAGSAKITGATGGLRVRGGAGTSYEVLATLYNGDEIVVIADGGGGWYQISYSGSGGSRAIGYILGEYIVMSS